MNHVKRNKKDRFDGKYIDLEAFHRFIPYLLNKRCHAEAFLREEFDVTEVLRYICFKNAGGQKNVTLFNIFVAAIVYTFSKRPHLNRFICGKRYYQREVIDVGFVAKKSFTDDSEEALVRIPFEPFSTLDSIIAKMQPDIQQARSEKVDNANSIINALVNFPRPILSLIVTFLRILNFYGKMPRSLTVGDPNFASVFISNMGSIKASAPYHHLNEWGTNSIFITIGEIKKKAVCDSEGNLTVRDIVEFGITIDERIADGFYYSKSIKILEEALLNPGQLETDYREDH
ncbi:hypothetical protein SDC9_86469 [bioreactor metagenome]|uniref:2-oxoacid dehydrogenase acyltransferase catalytic domain-containing protein n=1 Tax=bioreactor metagenome TaxID=1076179 RepID=A0A644ZM97_9ZZZZ